MSPRPLDNIRHVCLDKDGTFIDVHRYWCHTSKCRAEALRARFSLPESRTDSLLDAMGVDVRAGGLKTAGPVGYAPRPIVIEATVSYLRSISIRCDDATIAEIFGEVDRRQQASDDYDIRILPGAQEGLLALRQLGQTLTVFSSDRTDNVARVLRQLGLESLIHAIIGGDRVKRSKPDPEGFLLACDQVGIAPGESVYVGDTIDDLRMASTGGACRGIGVSTGLCTVEELRAHSEFVFPSLMALTD